MNTKDLGKLTHRELAFIEHFTSSMDASGSAIAAKYSPASAGTAATGVLNRPRVIKELKKRLKLSVTYEALSPLYVLRGLREVYERCMQVRPVVDNHGVQKTDDDGNHLWQFRPQQAIRALELIGKNYDMFSPDVVVNVNIDLDNRLAKARIQAAELHALNNANEKNRPKDITTATDKLITQSRQDDTSQDPLKMAFIDLPDEKRTAPTPKDGDPLA